MTSLLICGITRSYSSLTGWCARRNDRNPYLQIDLLMPHTITKVATQGAANNWVKNFSLGFSYDNINWFNYTVNGKLKVTAFSLVLSQKAGFH